MAILDLTPESDEEARQGLADYAASPEGKAAIQKVVEASLAPPKLAAIDIQLKRVTAAYQRLSDVLPKPLALSNLLMPTPREALLGPVASATPTAGITARPPDRNVLMRKVERRIAALQGQVAELEEQKAILADRVAGLELSHQELSEEIRRFRRDFYQGGSTYSIWPPLPDDDFDPTVN